MSRFTSATAAAVLAAAPLLIPGSAEAAGVPCHAAMSDATPSQYAYTHVNVRTAPAARVRAVAHYKTTNTAHHRKANSKGRASIAYYTSSSTPGYRVKVDVTVTKNGHSNHCTTSFTAHR